ncbi:MAG: UDP-N-acetylmuramoyl-tripeptide--D-alanyl-D-alanine ligase [Bacteroidetes bacterium]|nr:UDP-N-acetylmuramoyl-tripeptide--D-alanyl-D-alanine ligase [Bacteroidota bacterium]MDA1120829.1 UDP-N-acetylmuramoyl-tripeptide--D-alanyl-D-alanine ligase [Bacteroidota bacterium]
MTKIIQHIYDCYTQSTGVFTDTRNPLKNGLFFALSGSNFNGNKFAQQAMESGAIAAVIDDQKFKTNDRFIVVPDTLEALQDLARLHRQKFNGSVIGLTGSNGKTSTKELIHAVLNKKYRVTTTKGNLNNHIGVPLTILSIPLNSEIAVIEMGANHIGEIATLCDIAQPTHGLITNIGKAHLDGFGGIEGVTRAKSELYDYLIKNNGQVFINQKDRILHNMGKRFPNAIYYPSGELISIQFIKANPYVVFKSEDGNEIQTQLIGNYNFINIAAALCVGKYFNVPADLAANAIANYLPTMNRSQIIQKAGNTIILDAYNANPDSMRVALENISAMDGKTKAVILGDMLELGENADMEHEQLGDMVAALNPDLAFFCGKFVLSSYKRVKNSKYFETKTQLVDYLKSHPITDAIVLIKASRVLGLETLIDDAF